MIKTIEMLVYANSNWCEKIDEAVNEFEKNNGIVSTFPHVQTVL